MNARVPVVVCISENLPYEILNLEKGQSDYPSITTQKTDISLGDLACGLIMSSTAF